MRPVGCPRIRRCGHSSARSRRSVISAGLHVHVAVDAADHQVEFGQRIVGQVQRAILQNVALEAGEDADAQPVAIDLAHMLGECHGARFVQPLAMASALE